MASYDKTTLAGLLLGLGAIVGGQLLEGGRMASLLQPTALLIVVGGTLGAVMLQSPLDAFIAGLKMLRWVFVPPAATADELITRVLNWSQLSRRDGLLALEPQVRMLREPFHAKGLQLLIDGAEPRNLREVLEIQIDGYESRLRLAARIWESAGGYAPTIGILGAVLGLIHVMENLTDPGKLGAGIAVAFVATIYGVGLANLVFLPIYRKLSHHITRLVILREMFVDGLVGISNGDNPRIIEGRMRGHVQ